MMDKDKEKAELMVLPLDSFMEVLRMTWESGFESAEMGVLREEAWKEFKDKITVNIKPEK